MHDRLERAGWQVELADAQTVNGLRDRSHRRLVLAEFCRRGPVSAIWLSDPKVRAAPVLAPR